jgi:cyanophycinase-like exopeptidase
LQRRADEVRREDRLRSVSMLRDWQPADRVAARLEISTGRWLGGRAAGVDVMGDGSLVAFTGGIGRRELESAEESPFDAVRRELS